MFNNFGNKQVSALPEHLKQYIVPQHYEKYTAVDQSIWRYVMRQNYYHLKDIAYYPYIPGLKAAGLTIEKIPDLQEMNDALGKIGWGAVTVDGFIPPAAFMEYQAHRVLVIAADIRQLEHIGYTPAPDIIHESAGHAPIIAEKDYHEYLSYFGSIGAKALYSAADFALYEAIRALSILKEMPDSNLAELAVAERRLNIQQANMGEPSEMALLSRLHWWTVEYGLIGTLDEPKIYGAGLLSSIAESADCLRPDVKKIPYTIDALNYSYDITCQQPQLFVTPDFRNLTDVLEKFADTMAFRRGGAYGLKQAIASGNICTAVYSSGLQVSGLFNDILSCGTVPAYLYTKGPTALAANDHQLEGHSKVYHPNGFSSPVGLLKGREKALENMSIPKLAKAGIVEGFDAELEFASGVRVKGIIKKLTFCNDKLVLITFTNCTVTNTAGTTLFDPAWGEYDMAVGESITSVFSGAADKAAFEPLAYKPDTQTWHPVYDDRQKALQLLYQQVRAYRLTGGNTAQLTNIWTVLHQEHPEDWLCALEILELLEETGNETATGITIREFLNGKAANEPHNSKIILDGLTLSRPLSAQQG
ncbi:MAG: aromatic amino acid hydroxylase [Sphingobacteriales bacterium]|nr:MAG: aromatic amino acid hydroxylase [Sphingobacteriales bacterium]